MQDITFEINSIEELSKVSDLLISWRDKSNIIAFYGNMGAGKTTLVKATLDTRFPDLDSAQAFLEKCIGATFRISDIEKKEGNRFPAPPFALVNEYQTATLDSVFHFDFYRIKSLEEVFDIGYEDYFYGGSLCLLEWPELIDPLMPEHYIKVEITLGETDTNGVEVLIYDINDKKTYEVADRKIKCSLL